MWNYILRRLLLMIPTLFGIMVLNFAIIQAAPGGPVEQLVYKLRNNEAGPGAMMSGSGGGEVSAVQIGQVDYRGSKGLPPEMIEEIKKLYGFDKPPLERFTQMLGQYVRFDFGESFFRNAKVTDLVIEKLPVSISLGLWTTLLVYLISIPLGIMKATRDGSPFDIWSSAVITLGYAVPSFLFAVLLIILFAGGNYWSWFPLRGLTSEHFESLSFIDKVKDYFWHITLPVAAMVISGFASLTMLTKNSFIAEISKQYVQTARAKGLSERGVLMGHVFRNAMLIVIAGLPSALIGIMFTSNLLIEKIFSLDGLGLLAFESTLSRDYPVVFGTLFMFSLLGLLLNLIGDLMYVWIDPRIDFERREV
ncbi:MAG: microcin C ABC transporter permease YejB [Alphaproteobacteria bacterium]|nr:microcin C ABC transporter permease YejB [Alphaproteobacteria bacterium]